MPFLRNRVSRYMMFQLRQPRVIIKPAAVSIIEASSNRILLAGIIHEEMSPIF